MTSLFSLQTAAYQVAAESFSEMTHWGSGVPESRLGSSGKWFAPAPTLA